MTLQTYKVLGLFLAYPEEELIDALDPCLSIIKSEALLSKKHISALEKLIEQLKKTELLELQEKYVSLFDRTRTLSLHLFEHIHGESRDRGQAMVDLAQMYQEKQLSLKPGELPDFLPAFLEYLSLLPQKEAQELLGEPVNVLAALAAKLQSRDSIYHAVFAALLSLANSKPDIALVNKALAADKKRKSNKESLDDEWQEQPVIFAGNQSPSDCSNCDINTTNKKK